MLTKEQLWSSRVDSVPPMAEPIGGNVKDRDALFPKPVIGIDRDGILNEIQSVPIRSSTQFVPIPGALEAVALMRSKGYKVVIIFDQPDISKGLMSSFDVDNLNTYLFELLGAAGCQSIDGLYYCTSSDKIDMFSKHNTGMFNRAENELKLSFRRGGFYVGDSIEDIKIADKIKATPVLIHTGNYINTLKRLSTFSNRELLKKVKQFSTLLEFAQSLD